MANKRGLLIVLSSPSGGGKTSIYKEILKRNPDYCYSVSATTRPKRENETDGVSYHFLDKEQFRKEIDDNLFMILIFTGGYAHEAILGQAVTIGGPCDNHRKCQYDANGRHDKKCLKNLPSSTSQ